MSDADLIAAQLERRLDALQGAPWEDLAGAGFLDLLLPVERGGAAMTLEGLLPVAVAVGRHDLDWPIVETIIARLAIPDAAEVTDPEQVLRPAPYARNLAALARAGLMVGTMEQVQQLTIEYAQTRKQFGSPIGSFQAVQQQIAVLAEEVAAAGMAAQIACRGAPRDVTALQAALAVVRASQAAKVVSAVAHAVHGAIGISGEYALHRFTARLRRWRRAVGPEAEWLRQLGDWAIRSDLNVVDLARFDPSSEAN